MCHRLHNSSKIDRKCRTIKSTNYCWCIYGNTNQSAMETYPTNCYNSQCHSYRCSRAWQHNMHQIQAPTQPLRWNRFLLGTTMWNLFSWWKPTWLETSISLLCPTLSLWCPTPLCHLVVCCCCCVWEDYVTKCTHAQHQQVRWLVTCIHE